jgi:hypothetical protein
MPPTVKDLVMFMYTLPIQPPKLLFFKYLRQIDPVHIVQDHIALIAASHEVEMVVK